MEESRSVLLQVKIDKAAAEAGLVKLNKELQQNKKEQQALAAEIKKSGTVTDEQSKKQLELQARYKDLSTEIKTNRSVLENQVKMDQAKQGSINQLRAQLSALTKEWNSLSEEERENTEYGKQLEAQTKAISDKLKGQEAAIGDTRRQVGSYTESILKSVDGTGLLATITGKAKGAQEAYTATLNITKASLGGNISMLKALRLAMAATGIGAVVLLLGGLISFLTKTQEGMDKVSQYTKAFSTVIAFLTDKLSAVGKATFDWFSDIENAGDLFTKLGEIIKENLINRVKAFGVILDAIQNRDFTKLQDGIFQLGTGVENASEKAKALVTEMKQVAQSAAAIEKENQRIRDAELELNKERSRSRAEIKALKLIADDQTKSEKERAAAAQQALAIENGLLAKQQQLQQDKINNIKANQALTNNLYADNKELAEEEAKLEDLRGESLEKQIELNNKLNALRKQEASNRAAAAKALEEQEYNALQKRLADEKAAADLQVLRSRENSQERLEAVIALNEIEREIALTAKDLTANQVALLQAQYDEKELQARKDHTQKLLDIAKKQAEDFKQLQAKEYQESVAATDQHIAEQKLKITQELASGEATQQQYQARLLELQRIQLEAQLQNARDYQQSTTALEQQLAERRIAMRQEEANTKAAIAQAEYQVMMLSVQAIGDLYTIVSEQSTAAADFAKAVTLFELAVNTAAAIGNIAKGATAVGTSTAIASGPLGAVTGPVASALYYSSNVATVLANIAAAKKLLQGDAPKGPKFSRGGILQGNSHAQGGIQLYGKGGYYGEAEGGEPILTKNVSRNPALLAAASALNVAAGGAPLTTSYFNANGGIIPATAKYLQGAPAPMIDYGKLAEAMAKTPAPIIRWADFKNMERHQAWRDKKINPLQ